MTRLILSVFLSLILLTGCAQRENPLSEQQKINIKVQDMNTRALKCVEGGKTDSISIRQALIVLDSALIVKPNYMTALHNKYKLQYQLNDFAGMMGTIDVHIKTIPLEPEYLIHKAMIFDMINEKDSAKKYFEAGLNGYQSIFKEVGEQKITWEIKLQYIESLAFAGQNNVANEKLKSLKEYYYNQPYLKDCKLRTYKEWMDSWYLNIDGTDYTKQPY